MVWTWVVVKVEVYVGAAVVVLLQPVVVAWVVEETGGDEVPGTEVEAERVGLDDDSVEDGTEELEVVVGRPQSPVRSGTASGPLPIGIRWLPQSSP